MASMLCESLSDKVHFRGSYMCLGSFVMFFCEFEADCQGNIKWRSCLGAASKRGLGRLVYGCH